jgi:transcription elongation factor GreA
LGDLSENAEYHEAKNEQAFLYGKELLLEEKIRNARVIEAKGKMDSVDAGCTVEVENEGEKMKFYIVGSTESDPASGKISIDSPIGKALANRKVGEEVSVNVPAGQTKYKILSIA